MTRAFHVTTTRKAAKPHRCDFCRGLIRVGQRYERIAGFYEDFYTGAGHSDCYAFWCAIYREVDYTEDGLPWDLAEIFTDWIDCQLSAQQLLDRMRGRFPHAVCRLEFKLRAWLENEDEEE